MESVDTQVVETTTQEAPVLTQEQIDFNQQMSYAFQDEPPAQTPSPTETAPVAEAPVVIVTDPTPLANIPDYTPFLKETFGVESVEEAKAQWEALQALKNTPQTAKEIEFANEESKKLHELIRQGKTKEVTNYLKAQEMLESVDTMSGEQKLKLYIKMQNPRFDQELIDDEYNSLYTLNEDDFGLLEPLAQRKERLKLEQRLENDVQKAEDHFAAFKQKIELPEIQPQQVTIDEDYEAFKASNAQVSDNIEKVLVPAIKSLKESDVQLGFKVQDPNNKMEFDIALAPTPEAFEKARQDSLSVDSWFKNVCYDQTGKFSPEKLQRLILLNDNFDNYAQSIARQAVNAERVRVIAKEAPHTEVDRNFNVNTEQTELQQAMSYALS